MGRHYFNPTPDTIYWGKGGGSYICLEAEGNFRAKFQRVGKYKWTGEPPEPNFPMCSVQIVYTWKEKFCGFSYFFTAHGCQMYDDGTIEWDGSTGGYFEE